MPIVSSTYTVGPLEACGRRWVREAHVDDLAVVHVREYLGEASGQDRSAILAAHAAELNEMLAQAELEVVINGA